MIAAPISAYLTKILPINILAICVGGLIIFTNSNALMTYFIQDTTVTNVIRFAIICAIIVLVIITIIRNKNCLFLQIKPSKLIKIIRKGVINDANK